MRAARVLVVSAIAHAAVFAVLATVELERDEVVALTRVGVMQEQQPIEVVMLDPDPAPATATATAAATATATAAAAATATATATATASGSESAAASESAAGTESATATGTGGGGVDLGTGAAAARIAALPHARGVEPKISGKLQNTPGGGAVVHDLVTTMTMERDGNIKFADKPDIDIKLKLPIPSLPDIEELRQDAGKLLTDWYRDPYAATKFGPKSDVARHLTAVPGTCDSWGDVMCDDPLAPEAEKRVRDQKKTEGSVAGGKAEVTDALHRKHVGDPYASRKLKLTDETRDERIARGSAFRTEQLDKSTQMILKTLHQLWASERDAGKRRIALFELWDDCDESEGARGEAGARARAMIVGWIRTHLPQGAAGAYSDEEVARLHAKRTSKQPFTPYGGHGRHPAYGGTAGHAGQAP